MGVEELKAEIKKLKLSERAALAKSIIDSLDDLSDAEIESLWVEEAERRLNEMEQGLVSEIPADQLHPNQRA